MNRLFLFIFFITGLSTALHGQSNCNNHTQVTICPVAYLNNQTNAGMGDDAPLNINQAGEDVLYEINAPGGLEKMYVSMLNVTGTLRIYMGYDSCNSVSFYGRNVYAGNNFINYNVSRRNKYFLWIEGSSSRTWDLAIGGDSLQTYTWHPSTQGNLQLDQQTCATPMFDPLKPFFQVTFNGVQQTKPMTLAPLNVPGNMCIHIFFKNTTGIEAIKKFEFFFDTAGYSAFSTTTVPGFYLAGDWVASAVGNKITMSFVDALGLGKGDFSGLPNNCLDYHFCFNLTPKSNDPTLTNVKIYGYSDGFGASYYTYNYVGCCPSGFPSCHAGGGGPGGGSPHSFSFTFNDPGSPLPIELVSFDAIAIEKKVYLNWITASEINNDYFTIERSRDGVEWTNVSQLDGAGNSTVMRSYETKDEDPLDGVSYYRLKQTDFDGTSTYSEIRKVSIENRKINVYPNPAKDYVIIESENIKSLSLILTDITNRMIRIPSELTTDEMILNTTRLKDGIYFLQIEEQGAPSKTEKLIISK